MSSWTLTAAIIVNIAILIMEIIAVVSEYRESGRKIFKYYTFDSNIFLGISSAMFIVSAAIAIAGGSRCIPYAVRLTRYLATCTVTLTLIVVVTMLAPRKGRDGYVRLMLKGNDKYLHFICPVLSILSFLLFENLPRLPQSAVFIALIPTLVYAVIVFVMNIRGSLYGPYFFLHVHEQPAALTVVYAIGIIGIALLTAWLLQVLNFSL